MNDQSLKISELVPDPNNANKHTERGIGIVEQSLRKHGAGRSILIDKHNRIIAGNLTTEQAASIGIENVRIIETDGRELIAVKRTDLDLEKDPSAKELALIDNRASEVSLDWDTEAMKKLEQEINLGEFFTDGELERIFGKDKDDHTIYESPVQLHAGREYVLIICDNSEEFDELRSKLQMGFIRQNNGGNQVVKTRTVKYQAIKNVIGDPEQKPAISEQE